MNKQAAIKLLNNRQAEQQKLRLAIEERPENSAQALLIQAEMIKHNKSPVAAWKCLLPLNNDQLVVAPIFENTLQTGVHCSLFADNNKARIEPEIAFILGVDLPPNPEGYSESDIDNAVKSCHMALELMQDRFSQESDVSFYEKLADGLVNQGLFIGPEIDKEKAYLASEFVINVNQKVKNQTFTGKHPNQYPQKPLYWLINFMTKRGIHFTAGQAIITGSYAGIVEVEFNTTTNISYAGLGNYQVIFHEK